MKEKVNAELDDDELLPEYDESVFKNAVRGKYYERYRQGTNIIRLDPDVAAAFPNEEAVNEALRLLIRDARTSARSPRKPRARARPKQEARAA